MQNSNENTFEDYFSGQYLYGDDFTKEEIEEWYQDEAEGYAGLVSGTIVENNYGYHELNNRFGFSHIRHPKHEIPRVLGFGSANGDELRPIISQIGEITILDPSDHFVVTAIKNVPVKYKKPQISGKLQFEDNSFDLITCFGVLHHVPNVSDVIGEFSRVLKPGGFALIREPVVNMGDWRQPRPGLTKRERGIPMHIMERAIDAAKLKVISKTPCLFPRFVQLAGIFGMRGGYNSKAIVTLDALLSRTFYWNVAYNRKNLLKKIAPSCIFFVCEA